MTELDETTTAAPEAPSSDQPGDRPVDDVTGVRLRWWYEVVAMLALYIVYSGIRNKFGSATVGPEHAFNNAHKVITLERHLGLFVEENIQDAFLSQKWFLQFWNVFYGTFHFWVTGFALIWCYRRRPQVYSFWRNRTRNVHDDQAKWRLGMAAYWFEIFSMAPLSKDHRPPKRASVSTKP